MDILFRLGKDIGLVGICAHTGVTVDGGRGTRGEFSGSGLWAASLNSI